MGRRRKGELPAIGFHKASGLARVTLNGKDHWLGKYGSAKAQLRYDELVSAWIASGRKNVDAAPPKAPKPLPLPEGDPTVAELALAYLDSIKQARPHDWKRSSAWHGAMAAARALTPVGTMPAKAFGPRALQDVRRHLVDRPIRRERKNADGEKEIVLIPRSRRYVNDTIGRIRQLWRWAVANELVGPERIHALECVPALPYGAARRESEKRQAVPAEVVEATLPHLTGETRAIVEFIRWTGCRPEEAARLRICDIRDRDSTVWRYCPPEHKTRHQGKERHVPIGPRAQAIVLEHARGKAPDEYVFDPRKSFRRTPGRDTIPITRKASSRVGEVFTSSAIRTAVGRAAAAAGVEDWTPYQLRHLRLQEVRKLEGREAVQATASHARAEMSDHYAPANWDQAARAAMRSG